MSAKLGSIPIVDCATTIRTLAVDARNTHRAFDETQRQILRVPDDTRPAQLLSNWQMYTEAYTTLLHSSDLAATKLASTINIYLSLQGDLSEDDADDMIEELSSLSKDLTNTPSDMSASCMDLQRRVQACLLALAPPAPVPTDGGVFPNTTTTAKSRSEIGGPGGASHANDVSRRAWEHAYSVLAALQPPPESKGAANGFPHGVARSPSGGIGSITSMFAAAQSSWAAPRGPSRGGNSEVFATRAEPAPTERARVFDDTLVQFVKDILASLEKQPLKFVAFTEVGKHLENEMNAYKAAFQAVKTYPTPDKRAALQNMHDRVAVSARLWRELATVLTDGYARLQK